MMKHINKVYRFIALCTSLLLLNACDVHELPTDGGVDPTTVHTRIVLLPGADMIPFDLPDFSTRAADVRQYDVRYQVEIYADDKYDQSLQFRRILTYPEGYTGEVTLDCDLHARNYRVVAWRDFVLTGTSADCFYSTPSFSAIKLADDYVGGTDYKDAFSGQTALDLTPYRCKLEANHREKMQLERPLAKIMLITTDVIKYLDKLKAASTRGANIESLSLQVLYTGYFPVGFNITDNRPNQAVMGIKFSTTPVAISDNEACLAFDYVLVNGEESAVTLEMIIYNDEGQEVNRVTGVEVPIKRNQITTVRDKFLTRQFAPGIGINPGFDGEINVVVP